MQCSWRRRMADGAKASRSINFVSRSYRRREVIVQRAAQLMAIFLVCLAPREKKANWVQKASATRRRLIPGIVPLLLPTLVNAPCRPETYSEDLGRTSLRASLGVSRIRLTALASSIAQRQPPRARGGQRR
ncbi:hypothetical protein BJX64DRAFT_215934 [Aspergillus heterothallicus]